MCSLKPQFHRISTSASDNLVLLIDARELHNGLLRSLHHSCKSVVGLAVMALLTDISDLQYSSKSLETRKCLPKISIHVILI